MSDIQISGLTKRFGNAAVLQELDLTVRDGEFLTLLGASGCDKSTLLKLVAGLIPAASGISAQSLGTWLFAGFVVWLVTALATVVLAWILARTSGSSSTWCSNR